MCKGLLRKLDPEEQKNVRITDSRFPELLDVLARAKQEYEVVDKRYQTNLKYLEKLGGAPADTS